MRLRQNTVNFWRQKLFTEKIYTNHSRAQHSHSTRLVRFTCGTFCISPRNSKQFLTVSCVHCMFWKQSGPKLHQRRQSYLAFIQSWSGLDWRDFIDHLIPAPLPRAGTDFHSSGKFAASLESAEPFWYDFYSYLKLLLKSNVFVVRLYRMTEILNFFFFFRSSKSPLALFPLSHCLQQGGKKPSPKHQNHVPHYHSPFCPCHSPFIRPVTPLVTLLQVKERKSFTFIGVPILWADHHIET